MLVACYCFLAAFLILVLVVVGGWAETPIPTPTPEPVVEGGRLATLPSPPSPAPNPTPAPSPTPEPVLVGVALTFYTCPTFCIGDITASGELVDYGTVACGYFLEFGQRFMFKEEEYVCEDRGFGPYYWVDFWKKDHDTGEEWQRVNGTNGEIELR